MKSNDNHNHKVTDMNSKTTRVLSIDMGQEVVDFLRKENLETYDGTFVSIQPLFWRFDR